MEFGSLHPLLERLRLEELFSQRKQYPVSFEASGCPDQPFDASKMHVFGAEVRSDQAHDLSRRIRIMSLTMTGFLEGSRTEYGSVCMHTGQDQPYSKDTASDWRSI